MVSQRMPFGRGTFSKWGSTWMPGRKNRGESGDLRHRGKPADKLHNKLQKKEGQPAGWLFPCNLLKPLVRMIGLEPTLPCGNWNLNPARLPISPHPHGLMELYREGVPPIRCVRSRYTRPRNLGSYPGNTPFNVGLPMWRETSSPRTSRKSVVNARSRPS